MSPKDEFDDNQVDNWVKHFKSTVSAITGALGPWTALLGPHLSELVGATIPNQRLDRIAAYLRHIRIHVPDPVLAQLGEMPERIALLEEGLYAAGFTPHANRVQRIASAVAKGLSRAALDLDRESHILGIIRSLSYADVIVLQFHALTNRQDSSAFVTTHAALIPNTHDNQFGEGAKAFAQKFHSFEAS